MTEVYYDALIDHFQAKRSKARAELMTYLYGHVGIGEHSEILAEMVKKVEDLEHADGCISVLQNEVENFVNFDDEDE